MRIEYLTDLAMQCRVPPGDTSQLTTGIGSFLSTPLRETSGTALTEPRAHSRIHCIARSVNLPVFSPLQARWYAGVLTQPAKVNHE